MRKAGKTFSWDCLDQLIDQKLAAGEVKQTLVIRASDREVQEQLRAYRDRFSVKSRIPGEAERDGDESG